MAYISPCLTHFVGRTLPDDEARCNLLIKILRGLRLGQWDKQGSVWIDPGSMLVSSIGSLCSNDFINFKPVCFCDIPEDNLQRHTGIYGRFGIAFKKNFLVSKGANPVFYVAKGSVASTERPGIPPLYLSDLEVNPHAALRSHFEALNEEPIAVQRCEFFDRLVSKLMRVLPPPWPPGTPGDASDPIREVQRTLQRELLRHVFSFTKFFDESLSEDHEDNFYMEREWRVSGFVDFELSDVQSVYVAPGFRDRMKSEFPTLGIKELD